MIATATFVTERMQAAADSRDRLGDRSRRVARGARHAVPRSARDRRRARASRARRRGLARATSWPLIRALGPDAATLVAPGVSVTPAHHAGRRGPGPRRRPARAVSGARWPLGHVGGRAPTRRLRR